MHKLPDRRSWPCTLGQLILGSSNTRWGVISLPLSLAAIGMANCSLWVRPDISTLIVTGARGTFTAKLQVPPSVTLLGAVLFGQAWAPDPGANNLGVATTNAFKAVIGF